MTSNDDISVGEEVETDDDTHVFQNGDSALFSCPERSMLFIFFLNMEIFGNI